MQRTRGYTPWFGRPFVAVVVMAATLLVSCSGDDTVAPDTIAPLTSTTAPADAPTATDAPTTTVATTFADDPPVQLSADGPWQRVASAPGVTKPGLTYLLMPGVWVYLPTEENLDLGITWVLNEADRPIIEAYLMARLTYYEAVTKQPMDFTNSGWNDYYLNGGKWLIDMFQRHEDLGRHVELADGVVLRPEVAGEGRTDTTAAIFDCTLDGGVLVEASGAMAPGSVRGVAEGGVQASMQIESGRWKLDRLSDNIDSVCD